MPLDRRTHGFVEIFFKHEAEPVYFWCGSDPKLQPVRCKPGQNSWINLSDDFRSFLYFFSHQNWHGADSLLYWNLQPLPLVETKFPKSSINLSTFKIKVWVERPNLVNLSRETKADAFPYGSRSRLEHC